MQEPLPAEDHLTALNVKLLLHISTSLHLYISTDEQREQREQREHGDTCQNPLRVMLEETSTDDAPWDMIPTDDK